MHLYTFDSAPSPRRVGLFIAYKGLDIPTTQIDMRAQAHLKPEYLAINALGTVPALRTGEGVMLTEIVAICAYLEAQFPDKPLMGRTALEQALVLNWDHRVFTTLIEPFAEILRNRSPAFANRALPGPIDVEQIPALVDRGHKRFRAGLELFDRELGEQPFLCGEHFTQADIDLMVVLETSSWVKESLPESCTRLQAWLERANAQFA